MKRIGIIGLLSGMAALLRVNNLPSIFRADPGSPRWVKDKLKYQGKMKSRNKWNSRKEHCPPHTLAHFKGGMPRCLR